MGQWPGHISRKKMVSDAYLDIQYGGKRARAYFTERERCERSEQEKERKPSNA